MTILAIPEVDVFQRRQGCGSGIYGDMVGGYQNPAFPLSVSVL